MTNTTAKVGDRVALKRTNDKRSKWKYGFVTNVRKEGQYEEQVQVEWGGAGKARRKEWLTLSVFKPRVLLLPPVAELSDDVRKWCQAEGLCAVRKICHRELGYLFVGAKKPHNEICFIEEVTSSPGSEYYPSRNREGYPEAVWANEPFEQTEGDTTLMDGVRTVTTPKSCFPSY